MTSIRVICRLRPLNKKEIGLGGEICINFNEKNINVIIFKKIIIAKYFFMIGNSKWIKIRF